MMSPTSWRKTVPCY